MTVVTIQDLSTKVVVSDGSAEVVFAGVQGPAGAGITAGTNDGDVLTWDSVLLAWQVHPSVNISDVGVVTASSFNGVAITDAGLNTNFLAEDGVYRAVSMSLIGDVTITAPANDEVLAYNGAGVWINQTASEAGLATASDLGAHTGDATIHFTMSSISITESQISDLQAYLVDITAEPLSDLSDVTITTVASGEILKWSGTAWINNTLAEAGIAAAVHTHVEADITDLGAYIENVIEDTTPQLGGTLDCNSQHVDNAKTVTFIAENAVGTGTTINWTTAQKQSAAPNGATTFTFMAPNGPANLTLKLIDGATNTPTWPASVLWAGGVEPTWSTGTDIVSFYYDGTNYYAAANTGFA